MSTRPLAARGAPPRAARLVPLALLSCLALSSSCTKSKPGAEAEAETEAEPALEPAPEFSTRDLDGEKVSLADYRGQVVLLNTWATWCEPCVRELPELARLHEQLGAKGFTVIALNADVRSKLPAVRTMVTHHKLPFPIWLDFESKAQVAFKLRGYPTSFLIDREGSVRWKREGEIQKNDPELAQALEGCL